VLEEPVLVRHRLTPEDVAVLARLVRRSELRVVAVYLLVIGAVLGGLAALGVGHGLLAAVAATAAVLLAVALLLVVRGRRRAVGRELTAAFAPSGVGYQWEGQSGHLPWRALETRHRQGLLILVHDGRPVVAVPSGHLSEADLSAIAAWSAEAGGVADEETDVPDAVAETPDEIVVRGVLSQSRAMASGYGMVRRSVWWTGEVLGVAALAVGWATELPTLRAGGHVPVALALLTAAGAIALVSKAITYLQSAREVRRLGGRQITWQYSVSGVTVSAADGTWSAGWEAVRGAIVQGDMLVIRRQDSRAAIGLLVGPLSAQQRRRVVGWVEAGSGKRVVGAR
jgi:hypothetical protein